MRIFMAGDHLTGTGPANVTQYYIDNLPAGTLYQKKTSKIGRVPELIINTIKCDVAVYSGYSKQNILGVKLAHAMKKKCVYLMHGCVEYENEINLEPQDEMNRIERQTLELFDRIYAVSDTFAKFLKERYKDVADKIESVPNGIVKLERNAKDNPGNADKTGGLLGNCRDKHMIFTVGGGMPRKKIKHICEAIEILQKEYDSQLVLYVVGDKGADTDTINSYPFVINEGIVPFSRVEELLGKAKVFVQNSCFETFGLATVEAASKGCDILSSKEIGSLCVFNEVKSSDVIENYEDAREIADKLKGLIENGNNERLYKSIDWEYYSWEQRAKSLKENLEQLINLKK